MTATATHDGPAYTVKPGRAGGLRVFAAVMLVLAGLLDALRGLMGIAGDDVFLRTPVYVFRFDLTAWSWIHLALGVLGVLVGVAVLRSARWARVAGVAVAVFLVLAGSSPSRTPRCGRWW